MAARRPSWSASALMRLAGSRCRPSAVATRRPSRSSFHRRGRVSLEAEELRGPLDAGVARLDAPRPLLDQPRRRQALDGAIEQGAPAPDRQAMGDEARQIVGEIGAADAAHGTGDAHQHDVTQALGIDRGGCARRLQHGSRHGRASPQIGHCPRSGGRGRVAAPAGRANHRRLHLHLVEFRLERQALTAASRDADRDVRRAVPRVAPRVVRAAQEFPPPDRQSPLFRPTRVIFALWDCVRGNR